jgi:putative nucleotidyltransferase with HDIG domain
MENKFSTLPVVNMNSNIDNPVHRLDVQERQWFVEIMERANHISKTRSLVDLIDSMADLMLEVSGAEVALFYMMDVDKDELLIISVRGESAKQSFIGLRINPYFGAIGTAVSAKQSIITGDLENEDLWLQAIEPKYTSGLNSLITMPLYSDGILLAVFQLFNFQNPEMDILHLLSQRLMDEFEKLSTFREIQNSLKKQIKLTSFIQQLAGNLDREKLLHQVTESASHLLEAERSSISLSNPEDSGLNFQVSYQTTKKGPKAYTNEVEDLIVQLFQTAKKGVADSSVIDDHQPASTSYGYKSRSAISVPLFTDSVENNGEDPIENMIGELMVVNKLTGDFTAEDSQLLSVLASQTSTFLQISEMYENANDLFLGVVKSMVTAIDAKDPHTQGHSFRVSDLSVAIAKKLGHTESFINNIRVGSLLHDIGKIGIPDHILKKVGPLSDNEYNEIKKHTIVGHTILRQALALQPLLPAIIGHHERLNGSGYPYGLKGEEIHMMSRIVAVADVFDAMASERPYRAAIPIENVVDYIHNQAGIIFDQDCAQALIQTVDSGDFIKQYH